MSRDCCEVIHCAYLEDALNELYHRHVESPTVHWSENKIPDAIALQIETARKIWLELFNVIEENQITVDKEALEQAKREDGAH